MKQLLTINPDIFLWTDDRHGLLYDSCRFTSYKFLITPQISQICDRLLNPDNLYSIEIDMDDIDNGLRNFIRQVTEKGMGVLHDDCGDKHIISFPPLLNIQHSWERIKNRGDDAYNEILPYLTSITFYTGGMCPVTDYHKQTIYPVCSENTLSAERILGFLANTGSPYISEIHIVFSSVTDYPNQKLLLDGLREYGEAVTLYVRAEELEDAETVTMLSDTGINMAVLHITPFAADIKPMNAAKHIFLITSEDEYMEADKWYNDKGLESAEMIPIFNGCNAAFFHDNIFLTEQDILGSRLERRTVFAHMAVNTGFFGSISIMPDGKVCADSAAEIPIGCINDSVYALISAEMERNTAWRRTRDTLERCKKCIYRYLCPSPSAYETVMGLDCICTDLKEKGGAAD